jgi:ATP-dependent Clp endopeptidase proteolytic subunit ClpP
MSDQTEPPTDADEEWPPQNVFIIDTGNKDAKAPTVGLFGNLDEEQLVEVVQGLTRFHEQNLAAKLKEPSETDEPYTPQPINFYISTWGGDVLGMFAIYDLMRHIESECEIHTFGLGKVMSAGVLLLAAGTKGKRKVGKNTRLMLHSIQGTHFGSLSTLENEVEEARWLQTRMIQALVSETKLTKRQIQKMLDKKVDFYIDADEAIKFGIADIII